MWIPYDLTGSLKGETSAASLQRSQADRSVRDVLVGFFVRNPITQSWEIDIRAEAVKEVLRVDLDGMSAEIACYGDDSGKLSEIIYRVKGTEPYAAFDACRHDLEDRLARLDSGNRPRHGHRRLACCRSGQRGTLALHSVPAERA